MNSKRLLTFTSLCCCDWELRCHWSLRCFLEYIQRFIAGDGTCVFLFLIWLLIFYHADSKHGVSLTRTCLSVGEDCAVVAEQEMVNKRLTTIKDWFLAGTRVKDIVKKCLQSELITIVNSNSTALENSYHTIFFCILCKQRSDSDYNFY